MQDNNQKDPILGEGETVPTTSTEASEETNEVVPTNDNSAVNAVPEAPVTASVSSESVAAPVAKKNVYIWTVLAILVIGLGLVFVLEKDGRISTGIFSGVTENMKAKSPVATVNGEEIAYKEYDSSLKQLLQIATTQGVDTTDPEVVAQYKAQAIDTLINGEVLRQQAIEAGMKVTDEDVEVRFAQIRDGIGGQEALEAKMAEFGIDEETLRADIQNEILIQALFDSVIDIESVTVSDEEVEAYYDRLGGEAAGLPALAEVEAQIEEQIKLDKQQEQVGTYLEEIKVDADIEILI
ncbi:MAG: SurA N-terminal domain-containing protein [Candidatus Paceibacterota bacterium]